MVTSSITMPNSSSVVWSGMPMSMACTKITTTDAPVYVCVSECVCECVYVCVSECMCV